MKNSKRCAILYDFTEEKSNIYVQTKDWNGYTITPEYKYSDNPTYLNNIHLITSGNAATNSQASYKFIKLYVISDEKIEKGDYFISLNGDESYMEVTLNDEVEDFNDYADENWTENCKKVIATSDTEIGLPVLPEYFIQDYLERLNNHNTMRLVLIEIDKDNTVLIKPVQDSWNREEVLSIIREYGGYIACKYNHTQPILAPLDEWAENNL